MKNKKILSLIIISLLLIIILTPTFAMASGPIDNPDAFDPSKTSLSNTKATEKVKVILNVISVVGIIVGVITLTIIGVKYMLGSVQEKAEYKKTMFSYLIGAILLVSICTIVQFIYRITNNTIGQVTPSSGSKILVGNLILETK